MGFAMFLFIIAIMNAQCSSSSANATKNFVTKKMIHETLINVGKDNADNQKEHPVIQASQEPLLIVSTLDGYIFAINKYKGTVKWKIKESPIIQTTVFNTPFSLPDPTDGSVYVFGHRNKDGVMDLMKKMSLNIPELVARSPTRSTVDNSICTGSKTGIWFVVDPDTGQKLEEISHERTVTYCPMQSQLKRHLYIGRSEYKLVVIDAYSKKVKWNITYSDYGAHTVDEMKEYDLKLLTSTQNGRLVTLKSKTNEFLWTAELGSTVVAAYQMSWHDLSLHRVPTFSFGSETLSYMLDQIGKSDHDFLRSGTFRSTLYVGMTHSGLYALPAITHDTVDVRGIVPLITSDNSAGETSEASLVGHYQPVLSGGGSEPPKPHLIEFDRKSHQAVSPPTYYRETIVNNRDQHQSMFEWLKTWNGIICFGIGIPLALVVLTSIILIIKKVSVALLRRLVDEALVKEKQYKMEQFERQSDSSMSRQSSGAPSNGSLNPWSSDGPTAFADDVEVHEGWVRVGKIQYDPAATLGHGCEGTIVYRGEYDKRRVAVKRMLPECLTIADREVELLRHSDEHPNVLRYYCTEQDFQFRYIALDYCDATLKDFADHPNSLYHYRLTAREALLQAASGVGHLHRLEIVHRDLKPANVLLRKKADSSFQVVISDFGLCKRLTPGRTSFSQRSGLRGTEGWIAPEVIREDGGRMTYSVDVFSLGCVFYYVLSKGEHPFGNGYARQANILSHKYRLDRLNGTEESKSQDETARILIEKMISWHANDRPTIKIILKHPLFWDKGRQLQFLQEVSDRTERLSLTDPVCLAIEKNSYNVIGNDWTPFISRALATDLRSHRTYQGTRIVDLIRAIRNKKHHFRELPASLRSELGNGSPDQYISYFLERYPLLLSHVYDAMKCVAGEDNFRNYYCRSERSWTPRTVTHARVRDYRPPGDGPDAPNWRVKSQSNVMNDITTVDASPERGGEVLEQEDENRRKSDRMPVMMESKGEERDCDDLPKIGGDVQDMESEEEPVDIGRSHKKHRVRIRKKKKKKKKMTGQGNPGGNLNVSHIDDKDSDEEEDEVDADCD